MKKKYLVMLMVITIFVSAPATFFLILFDKPGEVGSFANLDAGSGYHYDLYVPDSYSPWHKTALLVMLHGGNQDAEEFALTTGMNRIADKYGFIVLYPEQSLAENPLGYWNWFLTENQLRGGPETGRIASMIDMVTDLYRIDRKRIYAAGLSAGAAMALNLGVCYPDLIQGVAMASGVAYGVADSVASAYEAMDGNLPDLETTAYQAYINMPEKYRHQLKVLIFQGDADERVDYGNAEYLAFQIGSINDLIDDGTLNASFPATPISVTEIDDDSVKPYVKTVYRHADGDELIAEYLVEGMAHAWSGGPIEASYTDLDGPGMSETICEYFGLTG